MDLTILNWFLSAAPILLFVLLMTGLHWGGSRAGAMSWIVTVALALIVFGGNLELIGYAQAKAFFLSADVLFIIWSALFLYHLTEASGTVSMLASELGKIAKSPASKSIFLGWLFPSFLQGMGGFGVPVAVAAPLLVSSGFNAVQAVIMSSIGIGWAVNFGSMASSFQTLLAATNLPGEYLAPASAILLGITVPVCGLLVAFIAGGWKGIKETFLTILVISPILALGQYGMATAGFWIVAATLPSLLALGFAFVFSALKAKNNSPENGMGKPDYKKLFISIFPYLILIFITLIVEVWQPLGNFLDQIKISIYFPQITTATGWTTNAGPSRSISIFGHPGALIIYASIISYFIFIKKHMISSKDLQSLFQRTYKSAIQSSLSIFEMVGIATLMTHTGMTNNLAIGLSNAISQNFYPLVTPFIGALGAFITGSNNNSNVLFAALQMRTAELLKLNIPMVLGGQTAGGSFGSVLSPAKVIVGCSTVGLSGKEGQVIGKLILIGIIPILVVSISVFLLK